MLVDQRLNTVFMYSILDSPDRQPLRSQKNVGGGKPPPTFTLLCSFGRYLDTGIANSAPCSMLSDQRCMIDFCLV